jgi:polyferredoxin
MYDTLVNLLQRLIYVPTSGMVHPGLSPGWVLLSLLCMVLLALRCSLLKTQAVGVKGGVSIAQLPLVGARLHRLFNKPYVLVSLRVFTAAAFLLVIYAGLFGTAVPERNLATMLTWTVWWSGVVISVLFVGSAWCAICPWDALATWLVRRRLWRRGSEHASLNLRVPKLFRNIWPALAMFVGLSWLELGVGVTTTPYATALLALLMVVLATISLALYERKAFCRYFCAVGRTLGAYSAMSPVALRPVNTQVCLDCKTLDCYHGTRDIEPCPTHLVMGRITQNTYCTSCGACAMSCPHQNVDWQVRRVGEEIVHASRPHWDEAWFILGLVALTLFHGFTMMPYWEGWIRQLAYHIGDSGRLLTSFTIGMLAAGALPIVLYSLCIWLVQSLTHKQEEYRRIFSTLAFSLLPLAFAYHIAHNLTHLVRESHGFWSVVANPLGRDTLPLTMMEMHYRHMHPLLSNDVVFALQVMLTLFGFWLALRIARYRVKSICKPELNRRAFIPILVLISVISLTNLWLLMQPMVMRM